MAGLKAGALHRIDEPSDPGGQSLSLITPTQPAAADLMKEEATWTGHTRGLGKRPGCRLIWSNVSMPKEPQKALSL